MDTARAFIVDATAVGEPAQRARPEAQRAGWLQPKLVALAVACLVLIFMVSRVLPEDAPSPAAAPTAYPTANLFLPTPLPSPLPTVSAAP